jgi:hypothetical protein
MKIDSAFEEPEEDPLDQPMEETLERETELETVHQSQEELQQQAKWVKELREKKAATCIHINCSVSFDSLGAMRSHHKKCKRFSHPNTVHTCTECAMRFTIIRILNRHRKLMHTEDLCNPDNVKNAKLPSTSSLSQDNLLLGPDGTSSPPKINNEDKIEEDPLST